MYKYILFDLDAFACDSAPGIIRCVQYAWKNAAKAPAPTASCCHFIGRADRIASRKSAA